MGAGSFDSKISINKDILQSQIASVNCNVIDEEDDEEYNIDLNVNME